MIPCPIIPIFTYGVLKTPHKQLVLAGKIEGTMAGRLKEFQLKDSETLVRTNDPRDHVLGEILWINPHQYQELIQALDAYASPSHKSQKSFKRILCHPITNEPIYTGITPTEVTCWAYIAH